MRKTTWLTVLICVNVALLAALVLVTTSPRTAVAQGTGMSDNYLLVSGQIQQSFDALYVLDVRERTLHTFYFRTGTRDLEYAGMRLLEQDFRHNRE